MNTAPPEKEPENPNNHLFDKEAYGEGSGAVTGNEESTVIGVNINPAELKTSDDNLHAGKMTVPGWMCSVVCAGLNMDDIISGKGNIESPAGTNGGAGAGAGGVDQGAGAGTGVSAGAEAILNALAASDKKGGADPLNLISSEETIFK